jgi:AraC-like DNA-binding protein
MTRARDFGGSEFAILPRVRSVRTHVFEPFWAQETHVDESCELLHVLGGTMDLALGRKRYRAEQGDTLLVPAHSPHRDIFDLRAGLKIFMISFDWPPSPRYFRMVNNRLIGSMAGYRKAEVARIVDRLRYDVIGDTDADLAVAGSRVYAILMLVLREAFLVRRGSVRSDVSFGKRRRRDLMIRAKQFIQEHYNRSISLEDAARALRVSPFYLSHVFSEESDFTLFHYLTTLRMEKARQLLQDRSQRVSEVARAVGYDKSSYFSKVFRKYFGRAPHELVTRARLSAASRRQPPSR